MNAKNLHGKVKMKRTICKLENQFSRNSLSKIPNGGKPLYTDQFEDSDLNNQFHRIHHPSETNSKMMISLFVKLHH